MTINRLIIAFLILSTVAITNGCKKGENDPFLSFRSRNARITGTWKLTAQETKETTITTISGASTTDIITTSYNGSTLYETDNGNTSEMSYSMRIEINKDGTYKMIITQDENTMENTGNWWWINSSKKKVRIAFDDDWGSLYIDQLKNKEMVLKLDESYSDVEPGYSSSTTNTATYTFEKE